MIRACYFDNGSGPVEVSPEQYPAILEKAAGLLWVDVEANEIQIDEALLRDVFGFHPLAVDDALQESHVPKVDDWGEYLYIVTHAVEFSTLTHDVQTRELDIFLGKHYIVTHHDEPIPAIERAWVSVFLDERHLRLGPDHLLYRILDEVVASYMPVVDSLDDEIDQAEDQVFGEPTPHVLNHIFKLKRAVLTLRRILGPQREVLNRLARDDYAVIDRRDRVYFRDVYDHLVRLHDITESIRDLISGALDSYLSVVNNRMNDIMKTLTIVTTLFMPISFLTGFFGMNFFEPVARLYGWTGLTAFIIVMLIFIMVPAVMITYIRRRKWM